MTHVADNGEFPRDATGVDAGSPVEDEVRPEEMGEFEGGDPVCWAHLLCPDCSAVLSTDAHAPSCPRTLSSVARLQ